MKNHTNKPVLERMIEILADNEHKTWASWQKWVQEEVCRPSNTGLIIPKEKVDRWKRQYNTDYKDLTDEEKESDRLQVYEAAQALLTLFNTMCDERTGGLDKQSDTASVGGNQVDKLSAESAGKE